MSESRLTEIYLLSLPPGFASITPTPVRILRAAGVCIDSCNIAMGTTSSAYPPSVVRGLSSAL